MFYEIFALTYDTTENYRISEKQSTLVKNKRIVLYIVLNVL